MIICLRGDKKEFDDGVTPAEIARSISEGLARNALVARVNGIVTEMSTPIHGDADVEFLDFTTEEGRRAYRHSTAHVLAQAVKRIYPTARVAIGPAIENGFYYDFDFMTPINMEALPAIEAEMKKIIKENLPIVREEVSRDYALEFFGEQDESYKIELINDLPEDAVISMYRQGDFVDLCAGPHIPSTGYIKAFKLTSIAGAYWRGDENNKVLTRIYGTSFNKKSELEEHLKALEEAKLRDHNKLGREMGIFMTDENIGQGLPLLMPKGAKLFQILSRFVEDEEERRGYVRTKTPYMAKSALYKISGHWDHYRDGMFVIDNENENEVMALRPMTCPFQYTIEMHGLIRLRQFTISEGHIICMPSQLEHEFREALELARFMLRAIGIEEDVTYRFSRWDPNNTDKYINDPEKWEKAEAEMEKILNHIGLKYSVGIGEAAFYGPKLDIQIKNVYGKEDTLITLQVDMFLAENFDMTYVDENGVKVRPYIIHRTSIGCYERTIALIIEKFKGAFPVWMAPEQVRVMSLTERTAEYAGKLAEQLRYDGVRAEADVKNEKIGYKIRLAQLDKIPYMLIIGDKEAESGMVSVRSRSEGDLGQMTVEDFIARVREETRTLSLK